MKLYEYQAKALYEKIGLPKPIGEPVFSLNEIPKALKKIGKGPWAIKAQVLAGGRGKAGGVKLVQSLAEAKEFSKKLLGKSLVTHQTGPKGEKVVGLLIEKSLPKISREMYVSVLLDRKSGMPILLASKQGGMDIETLAHDNPDAILRYPIDPTLRLPGYKARLIAKDLGFRGKTINAGASVLTKLVQLFFQVDASMVEINPLAEAEDGTVLALDGKITTDDNALFRHLDQSEWKEKMPQPAAEKKAQKAGISYIKLDGNIGCLVNGAGLAMATMDIIKLHGGNPANFLDVGGGANTKQVTEAFKIILSDRNVEGILVNIFGGIMRCDVIAEGVLAAAKQVKMKVPLVVRLEGNKAQEGKEILSKSKLSIIAASGLAEAASKIVAAIKKK